MTTSLDNLLSGLRTEAGDRLPAADATSLRAALFADDREAVRRLRATLSDASTAKAVNETLRSLRSSRPEGHGPAIIGALAVLGGLATIEALAELLRVWARPLNPDVGGVDSDPRWDDPEEHVAWTSAVVVALGEIATPMALRAGWPQPTDPEPERKSLDTLIAELRTESGAPLTDGDATALRAAMDAADRGAIETLRARLGEASTVEAVNETLLSWTSGRPDGHEPTILTALAALGGPATAEALTKLLDLWTQPLDPSGRDPDFDSGDWDDHDEHVAWAIAVIDALTEIKSPSALRSVRQLAHRGNGLRAQRHALATLRRLAGERPLGRYEDELVLELGVASDEDRTLELRRLERAMGTRTWGSDEYDRLFRSASGIGALARGLVFRASTDGGEALFALGLDADLFDVEGVRYELPRGASVELVHRVSIDDATAAAWRDRLSALDVRPPFEQLDREVHRLSELDMDEDETKIYDVDARAVRQRRLFDELGEGCVAASFDDEYPAYSCFGLPVSDEMTAWMVQEGGYATFPDDQWASSAAIVFAIEEPGESGEVSAIALAEVSPAAISEAVRRFDRITST